MATKKKTAKKKAKKKAVKKKTAKKKAVKAQDRVKHIKFSFLNSAAEEISIRVGETLSNFLDGRGVGDDEFTEILGVKGSNTTSLSGNDVIDGYTEIILVPNGGGGC